MKSNEVKQLWMWMDEHGYGLVNGTLNWRNHKPIFKRCGEEAIEFNSWQEVAEWIDKKKRR